MSRTITRRAIAFVVLAGGALALFLARRGPSAPSEPASRADRAAHAVDDPATSSPQPPASSLTVVTHAPAAVPTGAAPTLAVLQQSLTDYLALATYPPWSRVHSAGSADKLTWNDPIADDLPWDDRPGSDTIYRFDADKAHVAFGEALTSWIEVDRVGSRRERLPVQVQSAWVMSVSGPSQGRTTPLEYNDEGRDGDLVAGDHVYTNRFVPSSVTQLAKQAQHVFIQAVIATDGVVARPVVRDFTYAPRSDIEILGGAESIQSGMLVVDLDVDVHQAGIYTFEANVLGGTAGDQAIAYTEPSYTLAMGRQKAALKFFGRAFAEKRIDGPYVVKDVRCFHRFINGEEENFYETYPDPIATKPYKWRDFSGAEWSDPEKDETVANMSRLIEQTQRGDIGQPLAPPPGASPPGPHGSDPIR